MTFSTLLIFKGVFLLFVKVVSPVILTTFYTAKLGYRNKLVEPDIFKNASFDLLPPCATECHEINVCSCLSYNFKEKKCRLHEVCIPDIEDNTQQKDGWMFYLKRECPLEFENTNFNKTKPFFPGSSLTGSCKQGYKALSGKVIATCTANYQTHLSDICRLLLKDVALGKPAEQVSTFAMYGPEKAVDGIRSTTLIADEACTHTYLNETTWWRVDLLNEYYVTSVRMLNRGVDVDGQGQVWDVSDRLRNVTITIGVDKNDISTQCGFFAGPGTASELIPVDCPAFTRGRYVQISQVDSVLTLCEVDVFTVTL
ncbi:uncharacterized protein LOC134258544 [Saccostrea cucullata]|uniref:uncharacterized protein LOC134258544 n=1 Tax=Saccostrea cuccullata TaxID=36930 RepID=UPI002ED39486